MSGPRIAIIGAGMSGSVCAWALRRAGLSVTVFEMGRGGGGRMATRKSRNLEGFAANHGCPAFTASQPWFKSMVQQLMDEHVVRVWSGRFGAYDAGTQTATEDPAPQVMYVGSPGMSSICDKLLSDAERCFETQVTSFERKAERWVLTDKNAKEVGTFDWLVISSHSLAHPRWTQIFKTPPPLQTAAATLGSPAATQMIEYMSRVQTVPVMVLMLVYPVQEEKWSKWPLDMATVNGSNTLGKVVRQSMGPAYTVIVAHSTHSFAEKYRHVVGSTGTAARMGADTDAKKEEEVIQELYDAFVQCVRPFVGDVPKPLVDPILHRWGNCFPLPSEATVPVLARDVNLVCCGDHLGPSAGSVEAAAVSGFEGAQSIIAAMQPGKL